MIEKSNEYLNAIIDVHKGIKRDNKLLNPVFYKPAKFCNQQEYRLFARFHEDIENAVSPDNNIYKEKMITLMNKFHTVSIDGGIKDISIIVSVEDLLESKLYIQLNKYN